MTREYVIEELRNYPFEELVAFVGFVKSKFLNDVEIYYSGDEHQIVTNNYLVAEFFEFIGFKFHEIKLP